MNDNSTEKRIQEKGLNAPRLTPTLIDDKIKLKEFFKLSDVLTICVITLTNGFVVTGEGACTSPENYNKEIGEDIAFNNARDKIWQLEGYLLKQELYEKENSGNRN